MDALLFTYFNFTSFERFIHSIHNCQPSVSVWMERKTWFRQMLPHVYTVYEIQIWRCCFKMQSLSGGRAFNIKSRRNGMYTFKSIQFNNQISIYSSFQHNKENYFAIIKNTSHKSTSKPERQSATLPMVTNFLSKAKH